MNPSMRRRSLTALLAAVGFILMMASPASATPYNEYHVTTGLLTIDIDGPTGTGTTNIAPETFNLVGGDTSHECDVTTGTNVVYITTTPTNIPATTTTPARTTTFDVAGASFQPGYFNLSVNPTRNYRIDITNAMTVDSTGAPAHGEFDPHPTNTNTLLITTYIILEATITSDADTDCTFDNQFTCSIGVFGFITGENDVYHFNDGGATVTGDTYTFDLLAENVLFFETGTCDPPFSSLAISGVGSIERLTLQGTAA